MRSFRSTAVLLGALSTVFGCGDDATSDNRPPSVQPLQFVTLPGRTSEQTAGASDPDGDPLTFALSGRSDFGELTLVEGSPGRLRFVAGQTLGEDAVALVVEDGRGGRTESPVRLRVVEDRPIADPQTVRLREDEEVTIRLVGLDPRGTPVEFVIVDRPQNGRLEAQEPASGGVFVYRPTPNYHGDDRFVFEARDPESRQRRSERAEVSIVVEPVNDAPSTSNQTFSTLEDTPLDAELRAQDVDGDALRFELVREVRSGQLTLQSNGAFRYVPAPDHSGSDAFQFRVSDGALTSPVVTATISVRAVNDAPVVRPTSVTTPEGTPVLVRLEAFDVDGDAITVHLSATPRHGRAEVVNAALGQVLYQPDPERVGPDSFSVRASDGRLASDEAVVSVEVTARVGPITAPGLPDPGFAGGGRALYPVSPDLGHAAGRGLWPTASGGFLLYGESSTGLRRRPTFAELDGAGALLTAGGPSGFVRAPATISNDVLAVARDAQGRLLVLTLAPTYGDTHPVLLRRLWPDGAPDASFGLAGEVTLTAAGEQPAYLAVDAAGRIVVASTFNLSSRAPLYVTRLLESGALDPSFADAGAGTPGQRVLAEDATSRAENQVRGLRVEPDGRVLVVNQARAGNVTSSMETQIVALSDSDPPAVLVRLPSLDYTAASVFTEDGLVHLAGHQGLGPALLGRVNLTTLTSSVVDLTARCGTPQSARKLLGPDASGGRLVAFQVNDTWTLCRVLANGGVDAEFGARAADALADSFGRPDAALRALDPAPGGDWLLSGSLPRGDGPFHDWAVVRLSAAGEVVPGFATQGVLRVTAGSGNDIVFAHDTGADGRTSLLVRSEESVLFSRHRRLSVLRVDADGTPDSAFAGGEPVPLPFPHGSSYPSGAVKVDAAGATWVLAPGASSGHTLARFLPNGALDTTLGTNGALAVPSVAGSPLHLDTIGRLYFIHPQGPSVTRLSPGGVTDASYGEAGRAALAEAGASNVWVHDFALAADGGLVAVLASLQGAELQVVRLDSSGAPLSGFGTNGRFVEPVPRLQEWSRARVRFDAAGRVVVAVYVERDAVKHHLVLRLTADGALDPSFGAGGRFRLEEPALSMTQLAVDRLDRPLFTVFGPARSSVVRLTAAGQLDPSFGAGGVSSILAREAGSVNLRVGELSIGDGLHTLGLGPDGETPLTAGTRDGEAFLGRLLP